MGIGTSVFYASGWSLVDAFYMVVITVLSVGFEEVHPIASSGMKIFVTIFIMVGCTTIIYIPGSILQLFTQVEIRKMLGVRRMSREVKGLLSRDIRVDPTSPWVGRSIREIEHYRDAAIIIFAL